MTQKLTSHHVFLYELFDHIVDNQTRLEGLIDTSKLPEADEGSRSMGHSAEPSASWLGRKVNG